MNNYMVYMMKLYTIIQKELESQSLQREQKNCNYLIY